MKKVVGKSLLITFIGIVAIFARIIISNYADIKDNSSKNIPLNNSANSICFKTKIDHMLKNDFYEQSKFFVAGSSMGLNNISGNVLETGLNQKVYNLSSWGLSVKQLIPLMKVVGVDKFDYLLLSFNNIDFNGSYFDYDIEAIDQHLNGSKSAHFIAFLKEFNLNTFCEDWNYRYEFGMINNNYKSVNFDTTGSVLYDSNNFVIDQLRWNSYTDTTGFCTFTKDLKRLDSLCKKNRIGLFLIYTPSRPNLKTSENVMQENGVSAIMKANFSGRYFDMRALKIPSSHFCDGTHLFKKGADHLTKAIVDSINNTGLIPLREVKSK